MSLNAITKGGGKEEAKLPRKKGAIFVIMALLNSGL